MKFFNEIRIEVYASSKLHIIILSFSDGIFLMASIFDEIGLIVLFLVSFPRNFTLSSM